MLVPIDAHDLLHRIINDGWDESMVDALACKIPRALASEWAARNVALTSGSCELLPPTISEDMEVVTARGSHTTAAARIVKYGAACVYDTYAVDGVMSKSKILQRQPSMSIPLDKGIKYTVIRAELVLNCPKLMEFLSRSGNASHGVHRKQTVVQGVRRVHALVKSKMDSGAPLEWAQVAKLASLGMGLNYGPRADAYCAFVEAWSGGAKGELIDDVASFERTLKTQRDIANQDLKSLASIELSQAPRYIAAMVKAMLSAPPSAVDHDGFCSLFTVVDFQGLAAPSGKLRPFALEASSRMQESNDFISAYGAFSDGDKVKLLGELQVRMVLHVHQKKFDTRTSYKSLAQIMVKFYDDATAIMRKQGRSLPPWSAIKSAAREVTAEHSSSVRELDMSGNVTDQNMQSRGFEDGSLVIKRDDRHKCVFKIVDCANQNVTLRNVRNTDSEDDIGVERAELLSSWLLHKQEAVEVHTTNQPTNRLC